MAICLEVALPSGHVMLIDESDFALLRGLRLTVAVRSNTNYVRARDRGQQGGGRYVHNIIMGGRADHMDGDGLNNTRSNLRRATQAQNMINKGPKRGKKFVGVFFDKRRGTYYAQIASGRRVVGKSGFKMEEDAARWRDQKAKEIHGEWARMNRYE